MKIEKIYTISALAQNFSHAPKIQKSDSVLEVIIDKECEDTGKYQDQTLKFYDVTFFRKIEEIEVSIDMLVAYNSIAIVIPDTNVESLNLKENHYLIYFDGYGAFEIVASGFSVDE